MWLTPNLASKAWENCSFTDRANSIITKPLSSWSQLSKACFISLIFIHSLLSLRGLEYISYRINGKPVKRPCTFYSNSSAISHCLLEGDIVFKLTQWDREFSKTTHSFIKPFYTNPVNLISITREPLHKISDSLSLYLLNEQSVKNKPANILLIYYMLLSAEQIWLLLQKHGLKIITSELCPNRHKLFGTHWLLRKFTVEGKSRSSSQNSQFNCLHLTI